MDNKQIRDLIEDVVSDVPDGLACYDAYEQGKCDEERRIYRALMAKFPLAVKPAVVPWEDSKIGDVVEIDGRKYRVNNAPADEGQCELCTCDFSSCPRCPDDIADAPCNYHRSGCAVYFTEVKE